ncbi:YfjI family protein [Neptunomonas qingdaonensis]|uniref:DNA primase/helicase n=1 Tax=Neptunomonas qingdaonensis TaxID=1045558 RepID=A0A1I2QDL3_9GAMM|nr:YfjI family protein [Neptunomonas qingdaonensis]SFG24357.1 Protein of unknown function [Neptunomonas qingdaonensis]
MLIFPNPRVLPSPGQFNSFCMEPTLLWQACCDLSLQRQVSQEMSLATLLSGIAISSQGRYDVRLPYGAIRPISLYMFVVSPSGEGKTAVENLVMGPLKKLQTREHHKYLISMEQYAIDLEAWQLDHDILKQKVRATISKNGGTATKQKEDVQEHFTIKPKKPRAFRILYQNSTPEALFQGLNEEIPTAAFVTDEADIFFRSTMNQAKGHLNNFFSGDDTIVNRVSKPDILLHGVRVSALLMVQPGVLAQHLKPQDRDSGWLARFIVANPPQLRGSRYFHPDAVAQNKSWELAEERLKDLAEENLILLSEPNHPRTVLNFAPEAEALWYQLTNEIEQQMQYGGRFQECPDHATKLNDIVARVAALVHIFEQYEGDISENTLRIAIELCVAFSEHFQQVLMPPPQEVQDACLLGVWLDELRSFNNRVVPYNHIRQCGPSALRNKNRLRGAIDVMLAHHEIVLFQVGKTRMVDLMPQLGPLPAPPAPPVSIQ